MGIALHSVILFLGGGNSNSCWPILVEMQNERYRMEKCIETMADSTFFRKIQSIFIKKS